MNTVKREIFIGTTGRGRVVEEKSLQECVASLAFVANVADGEAVTYASDTSKCTWYVYASQRALDVDMQRGPINSDSPGWFAIISAEARS